MVSLACLFSSLNRIDKVPYWVESQMVGEEIIREICSTSIQRSQSYAATNGDDKRSGYYGDDKELGYSRPNPLRRFIVHIDNRASEAAKQYKVAQSKDYGDNDVDNQQRGVDRSECQRRVIGYHPQVGSLVMATPVGVDYAISRQKDYYDGGNYASYDIRYYQSWSDAGKESEYQHQSQGEEAHISPQRQVEYQAMQHTLGHEDEGGIDSLVAIKGYKDYSVCTESDNPKNCCSYDVANGLPNILKSLLHL